MARRSLYCTREAWPCRILLQTGFLEVGLVRVGGAIGQRRAAGTPTTRLQDYVVSAAAACSDGGPGHASLGISLGPEGVRFGVL